MVFELVIVVEFVATRIRICKIEPLEGDWIEVGERCCLVNDSQSGQKTNYLPCACLLYHLVRRSRIYT